MRVEIPDCDALRATRNGVERGDGDVTEIAKAHWVVARRVMARGTIQDESRFTFQRCPSGFNCGAGRLDRIVIDSWNRRGIEVEISGWILHPFDVFGRMCAEQ